MPAPERPAPPAAGPLPARRDDTVAFVGGGHMASALIGGLLAAERGSDARARVIVVDPLAEQRDKLARNFGVAALAAADARLAAAGTVVWAVKPQSFAEAVAPCAAFVRGALQLSVMAGIRSAAIARALGLDEAEAAVVRAMPNTPALIGRGIAGLHATPAVRPEQRARVEALLAPTGATLWLPHERDLDAVTALSGSGPAYVFYLLEAMMEAGVQMGLAAAQARQLAIATFDGAAELARRSSEPPQALRAQVTSKGGTTHAAITSLDADGVKAAFVKALRAAERRAQEMGDEFGRA
ncbi:MAG: pyrroline-5-carboxylate reductase [Rubrivivax sp.]|nr:pyrroline-5-carboxylate reductase [Rubrivivax sp.]